MLDVAIFAAVLVLGAVGGLVNCAISQEFVLPKSQDGVWRPGWIGNVFVGAIGSFVVTGLSGYQTISQVAAQVDLAAHQLWPLMASSIITGLGGGKILTALAQQKAEQAARKSMVEALETLGTNLPKTTP